MTLSRRGDYVMRSAISLARAFDDGGPRKIREVVADTSVPQSFASQILADLVRAGLATSRAGREGGFRLARPPQEISVLEVIEAGEGPLRAERCALGEGPCRWDSVCPLHETWSEATSQLRDLLARTSLADVAARDRAIEAGTYLPPPDSHRSHPMAVSVGDSVQVELSEPELHVALARAGSDVGRLAAAAFKEVAGDGPLPRSRRSAATGSLAPVGGEPVPGGGGEGRYLLAWRVSGPEGSNRFEADVSVGGVDAERCEIRVEGTWYQDGEDGARLDGVQLEHRARRTVRIFLRRLARLLDERSRPGGVPQAV